MKNREEEYQVQGRIEQEEAPSPAKQAIIGVVAVAVLLTLPAILEWMAGGKPWRF
jgi:hypothetical protein